MLHDEDFYNKKEKEVLSDYGDFISQFEGTKYIIGEGIGALYAMRLCQLQSEALKGAVFVNPLFSFKA